MKLFNYSVIGFLISSYILVEWFSQSCDRNRQFQSTCRGGRSYSVENRFTTTALYGRQSSQTLPPNWTSWEKVFHSSHTLQWQTVVSIIQIASTYYQAKTSVIYEGLLNWWWWDPTWQAKYNLWCSKHWRSDWIIFCTQYCKTKDNDAPKYRDDGIRWRTGLFERQPWSL